MNLIPHSQSFSHGTHDTAIAVCLNRTMRRRLGVVAHDPRQWLVYLRLRANSPHTRAALPTVALSSPAICAYRRTSATQDGTQPRRVDADHSSHVAQAQYNLVMHMASAQR